MSEVKAKATGETTAEWLLDDNNHVYGVGIHVCLVCHRCQGAGCTVTDLGMGMECQMCKGRKTILFHVYTPGKE